jgi:serine protease AprX
LLGTHTSRKAFAAFVIALACVFGAPAVAKAAFVPPPLQKQAAAKPGATLNVIVLGQPSTPMSTLKDHVKNAGGSSLNPYSVIRGMTVNLTGSGVLSLLKDSSIRSITPNGRVARQSVASGYLWPYAADVTSLRSTTGGASANAPAIAMVDSGVDTSKTNDFGNRILGTVDFTNESGGGGGKDLNGHGTMVAGIAAGSSRLFTGVSPNSGIYSLRVVHSDGSAYTGDVIAAADWIYKNAFSNNIRVANFSLRSSFPNYASYDPLDAAVRRLWLNGTVVVASAGNDGPGRMLYAPANDPFVITVGASDIGTSVKAGDDTVAPWSAYGYTPDGFSKPDIGAPGRYMVGPVPVGSVLTQLKPANVVSPGYMQLSGTSFAAPVVSAAAAMLVAKHPDWSPDQVKGALMVTATPELGTAPGSLGVGDVDLAKQRTYAKTPPNPNAGLNRFVKTALDGTRVFDPSAWQAAAVANKAWNAVAWSDAAWSDAAWSSVAWSSAAWADVAWASAAWGTVAWSDVAWSDAAWSDVAWADSTGADSGNSDSPDASQSDQDAALAALGISPADLGLAPLSTTSSGLLP